jgi:phospholipase A1
MNPIRSTIALIAALAAFPVAGAEFEACRTIVDNSARLACYDLAAGRADAPAPSPAAAPAPAAAPSPLPARSKGKGTETASGWFAEDSYKPQSFVERWELEPGTKDGVFRIKPYEPVYMLPANWRQKINVNPCSPNPANCAVGGAETAKHTEAKFQLSFKTKVWQDVFGSELDMWAAYTQQSFWQVYDAADSRPFRETNYQPEAWVTVPLKAGPEWLQLRMVNIGIVHQSNGQSDPLSRSWNRVYASFGMGSVDGMSFFIKPWWRVPEDTQKDNNPDISDYAGRIELQAIYPYRANVFSIRLHNNLKFSSSTPNRTSVQADWAFPLYGELHGYVQGFYGWADSLQNYNFRNAGVGLGFSLIEWR